VTDNSGIRLNKFISDSGFCSRREADRYIDEGAVVINGQVALTGVKVQAGDEIKVEGRRIRASAQNKADRVYIAYNKPVGITCTTESGVQGNIIDAIGHRQRIFPIGRLDKPSEGLIFLTSDGDIVNKILRAENVHDKEYVVTVDKPLSSAFVEKMSSGIPILGTVTEPCRVTITSRFVFKIILTQGLNRQIRRMCEYLGFEVTKLKRSRIMNVTLGKLKPGEWRNLSPKEMDELNEAVAGSSGLADESSTTGDARRRGGQANRSGRSSENRGVGGRDGRATSSGPTRSGAKNRSAAALKGEGSRGDGRSKLSTKTKPKTSTNRTAKLKAAKLKANKKQAGKAKPKR